MTDNLKDILLIPVSIIFNYAFALLGFISITIFNQIIIGLNFDQTDLDQFLANLTYWSFEGLILLGFLYFVILDLWTLISRKGYDPNSLEDLENYSSKGKLLLNKANNLFKKVPFENSLSQSYKIYLLRIFLILILLLPLYLFQLFIFLFTIVPTISALTLLIVLLGSALLYQFDTKIGKKIEYFFLKYLNMVKPDSLESLRKKA